MDRCEGKTKREKNFGATRKKSSKRKLFFEREKKREKYIVKDLDERETRDRMIMKLYWQILEYNIVILEAWKLNEGRTWFGTTRTLDWSFLESKTGRLRRTE